MKKYSSFLLLILTLLTTIVAKADIVVIANPSVNVSELNASEVKRLFLGKTTSLKDGTRVELVDQKEGNKSRKIFYSDVVGKNPIQLKAYWAKRVFSGKGMPPIVIGDDQDVVNWIGKTKNAIGYIDKAKANDSVKVLFTLK